MQKQKRERKADEELFVLGHEQRMATIVALEDRIQRDAEKYLRLQLTTVPNRNFKS